MYHIFYPDPTEPFNSGDAESYLHETADTEQEAIELGEQAAAKWRGLEREDVMIFGDGHEISLPEDAEGHRCPSCGHLIDVRKFDTEHASEKDYDRSYGAYKLGTECPECGETVYAWFTGDPGDGDGLEFYKIDEFGEPPAREDAASSDDSGDDDFDELDDEEET